MPVDPQTDAEILQELWRTLVRLVPSSRRSEALALANVLHHFLTLPTDAAVSRARKEGFDAGQQDGYERGYAQGLTAGRLEERKAQMGLGADEDETPDINH